MHPGHAVVALGGTFDHLHAAHKMLLHLALFLTTRRLIVGVMSDQLLSSKTNASLVEPLDVRRANIEAFLYRCGGRGMLDVQEIHDALGPTGVEADIHALVVSRETGSGGEMVKRVRRERGLPPLEIYVMDVISFRDETDLTGEVDETKLKRLKMGSTGIRQWLKDHQ
ncbi:MAG: hypothetical protein TREMPRED_005290 [Tremellales sp. Tagirdzhanova-0007]|nr:MAG: hypothetical protein TREMPRED_005290 [Tremellales sp. Tagirdzhanova-0007]